MDLSALKEWRTPMRFSRGSRKFLELENRQHNGWPCAPFGSPTRFQPRTAILRACLRLGVRVNLSNARRLGAPGELTRPYISGLSQAKSERAEVHQLLPHAKKALRKRLLCTPESKWPCDRLHSINARIHLYHAAGAAETSREGVQTDPSWPPVFTNSKAL